MKSPLFTFVAGAVLGAAVASAYWIARNASEVLQGWNDLHVLIEGDARDAVKGCGLTLAPEARDVHFAQAYILDPTSYARCTLPRDGFWDIVRRSWAKDRSDLLPMVPASMLKPIHQGKDQRIDTGWWAPDKVKRPLSWAVEVTPKRVEYWLLDEDEGYVYIQVLRN